MHSICIHKGKFILILPAICFSGCNDQALRPEYIVVETANDVIQINELHDVPLILYNNEFDFSQLPVERKKESFINLMLPSILAIKYNYDVKFRETDEILRKLHAEGFVSAEDSLQLNAIMNNYGASDWWDLRRRLKTHPVSIVLAQAAVESGWGSSRFFIEANNVFGIWSFDRQEERIRSGAARGNTSVYLRAYPHVAASIQDYFDVLSTGRAYHRFRAARTRTSNPLELINYLNNYSELRGGYIRKLRTVIRQNNLARYDSASLSRRYTTGKKSLNF